MPVGGAYLPEPDPDRLAQAYAAQPLSQGARYGAEFDAAQQLGTRALHLVGGAFREDFGIQTPDDTRMLTSEEANDQYGVDGYKRFNAPVSADDAAFQSAQAHQRRWTDIALSQSRPTPLRDLGVGLAGTLTDPAALALMFATDGIGNAGLEATGAADALDAGLTAAKLGRVGNAAARFGVQAAKGAAFNAPFVAVSGGLANYAGDDYTLAEGLRDIAAGAVFHLAGHYAGKGLHALLGRDAPAAPAGTPPEAVDALPPASRAGAFAKALDDAADDRPVDVGALVQRELEPATLSRLDEPTADPAVASWRPLEESTAVTTRGTEVPVRYGLAELGDLTTSHDDGLSTNPAFPPELQPRDRGRAGAQARNHQLESELNPKLLMNDVSAGGGAPIVSPAGVVESGNGRTIALRRSAAKGGAAYARYKAELEAQGFDITGMERPVLVRMRTQPMEGAQRAGLAREMNADVTERMSATEQAMADAQALDPATLEALGDETAGGRRKFARAFLSRVAPDQVNQLVAPDGALSKAGQDRIDAALVAKAYGDPRLVEALFEAADPNIRAIGAALKAAAPTWAKLRAAIEAGEVPAGLDLTDALISAVDLVRHARDEKIPVGQLIEEKLGQKELFGGEAIGPETEAFLRLFFRDERFTRPLASDKLGAALTDYATRAQAFTPGPDLFGATPDVSTAREIIGQLAARFARDDAGDLDLRAPGRPGDDGIAAEARPPVIDLREPGGDGDGGGQGVPSEGEPGAEKSGGTRLTGDQLIAADPELKALAEDTDRLAAENGYEIPADKEAEQPNTLAEAVRAAAVCIAGELP